MEALVKLSSVRTIASSHVKAKNESSREISRQITATWNCEWQAGKATSEDDDDDDRRDDDDAGSPTL